MRVNIFGGPGVGKSTLAAQVYSGMRQKGWDAELVQEWIKPRAFVGRKAMTFDSVYTFAQQLHREDFLLQSGVETVVTDSPVFLQVIYAVKQGLKATDELIQIARQFDEAYPSVNFYLERPVFAVYDPKGRNETLEQAMEMDCFILDCLHEWGIPIQRISMDDLDKVLARHAKIG